MFHFKFAQTHKTKIETTGKMLILISNNVFKFPNVEQKLVFSPTGLNTNLVLRKDTQANHIDISYVKQITLLFVLVIVLCQQN